MTLRAEPDPSAEVEDGRIARAAQKRERRRQELLQAALRVFAERGYHQTRITDLIEAAGVARGTFYLYFDSKHAIFHELLDLLLDQIRANMVGVDQREGAPPVRDQLLVSVRRIFRAFYESPDLASFVMREAVGLDEESNRKLRDFYDQLHTWLAKSLANGQKMGLVRPLDVDTTAWCILGSFRQFVQLLFEQERDSLDLDHLTEVILDYNLQGILASSAR